MRTQLNNTEFKVFFRYPSKKRKYAPVFPALIAQACLPVAGVGESHV